MESRWICAMKEVRKCRFPLKFAKILQILEYSTDFRVSANRNALVFTLRVKEVSPIRDNGLYACQGDRLVKSAEIVNLPVNSSTFPKAQFFPLFSFVSFLLFLSSPLLFPWRS
jgi:hypothetical protein